MANKRQTTGKQKRRRPALTPEARENQLIASAMDLAEKQILEGTASPSVITHFLKLGSTKEHLEKDKLRNEIEYVGAKTETIRSAKNAEQLYAEALEAMRVYSGSMVMQDADSDL